LCAFAAAMIPHLDEQSSDEQQQWVVAIHGKFLSQSYSSPDAFLAAVNDEARKLHGGAPPASMDKRAMHELVRAVTQNSESLVQRLAQLENTLGQSQKQTTELRFAAFTDQLTRAYNRRGFFEFAERRINMAAIEGKSALVLAIDLDQFKAINDTYGTLLAIAFFASWSNCYITTLMIMRSSVDSAATSLLY